MTKHDDFGGLQRDLPRFAKFESRRSVLGVLLGAVAVPLIGCPAVASTSDSGSGTDAPGAGLDTGGSGTCTTIPSETGGPYPGDGSNGPNILTQSGVVRADIRSSIGTASGIAAGVLMRVKLTILDTACAPRAGYAVYLWHCTADGNYSMYSASVLNENFLRGVQVTNASGEVEFTTIVPGCYSGRWPHMHFEIYPTLAAATTNANAVKTSQLALPQAICDATYAEAGYAASVANLRAISLATDNVFSDGASQQVASVTGGVSTGFDAALAVTV